MKKDATSSDSAKDMSLGQKLILGAGIAKLMKEEECHYQERKREEKSPRQHVNQLCDSEKRPPK